jgi:predicted nucleic acid-binding protein
MQAVLDINVLIALLDPDHSLHERAREWFSISYGSPPTPPPGRG